MDATSSPGSATEVLATRNAGKIKELNALLSGLGSKGA